MKILVCPVLLSSSRLRTWDKKAEGSEEEEERTGSEAFGEVELVLFWENKGKKRKTLAIPTYWEGLQLSHTL